MQIDWTPVAQAAVTALATILPPVVAIGAAWLQAHNHRVLADAVQTGGGVAYDTLVAATRDGSMDWQAARAAAVEDGMHAVKQIVRNPGDVAALATKVTGSLGRLLAADPSVPAGGASVATAVATSGPAEALAGPQ